MEQHPILSNPVPQKEAVRFDVLYGGGRRFFATFLICAALLIAAFAVFGVWKYGTPQEESLEGGTVVSEGEQENESTTAAELLPETGVLPPADSILIRDVDLSCTHLGNAYLHDEAALFPNVEKLMSFDVSSTVGEAPIVLILHTHTSEAYLSESADFLTGDLGRITYTENSKRNVISVGKVLKETLSKHGINAIHCVTSHDGEGAIGSYASSAESIRFFLDHYPSIRYVVDLHRDSVLNSAGEYICSVSEEEGERVAQVMPVVGCGDRAGDLFDPSANLALALQLRSLLNAEGGTLCRPVTLRHSRYNQELAPYSLLLEVGTGANTVEEAKRAAALVGEALASLIRGQ